MIEPDRPQLTIWRMHFACWITKSTNTHSEYVKPIAFPLQHWSYECASMLRSVHCLSFTETWKLFRGQELWGIFSVTTKNRISF